MPDLQLGRIEPTAGHGPLYTLDGIAPRVHPSAFIAPNAAVIGNVEIGPESGVWFGCVIRGDTIHFEIVSMESSRGLMDLSVSRSVPLGNGIITVNNEEQAWERARANKLNKGGDAARAAIQMIRIKRKLAKP